MKPRGGAAGRASGQARVACAAVVDRPGRHAVAHLEVLDPVAHLDDRAGELVPQDLRGLCSRDGVRLGEIRAAGVGVVVHVQIGSADAHVRILELDLAGQGCRLCDIFDPEVLLGMEDDGLHGHAPIVRARARFVVGVRAMADYRQSTGCSVVGH
ncbi:unannotated protein [freshwater metagenome]|uniref:Unannotated protein n=1 Tax=freshwater metagenome TaxID=449393 RepID=A0A6J7C5G4_9ZZZZ